MGVREKLGKAQNFVLVFAIFHESSRPDGGSEKKEHNRLVKYADALYSIYKCGTKQKKEAFKVN